MSLDISCPQLNIPTLKLQKLKSASDLTSTAADDMNQSDLATDDVVESDQGTADVKESDRASAAAVRITELEEAYAAFEYAIDFEKVVAPEEGDWSRKRIG